MAASLVLIASTSFALSDIIPLNQNQTVPFGMTYGEWSAQWWKRALGIPTPMSPLLDTTGENCAVGQLGKV